MALVDRDVARLSGRSFSWKLYCPVAVLGIFLVVIMNYGIYFGYNLVDRQRLFVAEAMQVEAAATGRHQQLEEMLQAGLDSDLNRLYFIQASATCGSLLLLGGILFAMRRFELRCIRDVQNTDEVGVGIYGQREGVLNPQGVIPICGHCRKMKDELGNWKLLEAYIRDISGAQFSHGICPDCYQKEVRKIKSSDIAAQNAFN